MAVPYGTAIWQSHIAEPYSRAIWHGHRVSPPAGQTDRQTERRSDRWSDRQMDEALETLFEEDVCLGWEWRGEMKENGGVREKRKV